MPNPPPTSRATTRMRLSGPCRIWWARPWRQPWPFGVLVEGPGRALGAKALGAAHILGHHLGIDRAEAVFAPIRAGQDVKDARQGSRRARVDRPDAGVRMRRKEEPGIGLARQIDVGDIAPSPGQKAPVLFARHGLSDAKAHGALPRSWVRANASRN